MNVARTSKHFLLVGNGPYSNRGCEAIVRGTMAILRHEFSDNFRVTLGTLEMPDIVAEQAAAETDPLITHVALRTKAIRRGSWPWWRRQILRGFIQPPGCYAMLNAFCADAACALQVGGDNYTLDYGSPRQFMRLDDYLHQHDVPVVLWGASVGPFEADPAFAREMLAHLRAMRAIFLRESDSYEYLKQHGVDGNLHRMSDPAFAMEPVEPPAAKIGGRLPTNPIGLNLSPLMARYVTGGDVDAWVKIGADMVQCILDATQREVLLVPHVTWAETNDHAFLRDVAETCARRGVQGVFCLSDKLSAAETKWVISRCAVFAGARTHSTIAAFSTCVPTLSLAYSRKAKGLNQDIFGNQDYCLQPAEITPLRVAQRIADVLSKRDAVRAHLAGAIPSIRANALQGGAAPPPHDRQPMNVSVVIPLYNKARHIARAIDSIVTQTYGDLELIVVDDGSSDGGGDIVRRYTDPRIRLIVQANAGPGAARNRGLREAKGELVAFLDADDQWLPDYLQTSVALLEQYGPEVASVSSGYFLYPLGKSTEATWRQRGLREGIWRANPDSCANRVAQYPAVHEPLLYGGSHGRGSQVGRVLRS